MGHWNDLSILLAEIHRRLPDMRYGQVVCNIAHLARGYNPGDVWEVEDHELLAAAKEMLEGLIENGIDHSNRVVTQLR